jgi:hypothetical protein
MAPAYIYGCSTRPQVDGREWSFGGGDDDGTGVYPCRPECNDMYKFKERLVRRRQPPRLAHLRREEYSGRARGQALLY